MYWFEDEPELRCVAHEPATPAHFVACFAFFSSRFSFSVLPDFFDMVLRGDLSLMRASLGWVAWSAPYP